mgnify:CR=1 FL=1
MKLVFSREVEDLNDMWNAKYECSSLIFFVSFDAFFRKMYQFIRNVTAA